MKSEHLRISLGRYVKSATELSTLSPLSSKITTMAFLPKLKRSFSLTFGKISSEIPSIIMGILHSKLAILRSIKSFATKYVNEFIIPSLGYFLSFTIAEPNGKLIISSLPKARDRKTAIK